MTGSVPVLLITGPVGVGKTSVGTEVSTLLEQAGAAHAFVDMDSLRWCYPPPPDDPFHFSLALRNLAAVWVNFRAIGTERLVLANVLESRDDLAHYQAAIPGADILVVRLRATVDTLTSRLRGREAGAGLDWRLRRTVELATQMERDRVEDVVVETDSRPVLDVAREVTDRWGSHLDGRVAGRQEHQSPPGEVT